ncbi:MAG TPA: serine/threonine-protein kinase [Kofleriaceae bacterium]
MRVVCANCDAEGAAAGTPCPACGTLLVQIHDDDDLVGRTIDGRFELIGKLGKGGMGTVYRANQISIGREVALKLIDRRFEGDVLAVKRFLREAQLASKLAHPNTVGVIDFGQTTDGRLYLAMELVKGKTLFEAGVQPLAHVVRIGVQLCDALQAAHAVGIVHRDLKLENVIVLDGDRDHVKVLDFGLARSLLDPDGRATEAGLIAGTPRYLSPEVALNGAPPAPAQDLYALGVLLGELAGAGTMWDAPTIESLFTQKAHGAPNLEGLPAGLRSVIARLLDPSPEARPDAAATRAMLQAIDTTHAPIAFGATSPALELPSAAFAPPRGAPVVLEIEQGWIDEKAAKAAVHQVRQAVKPPRRIWGVVAAVIAIAAVVIVAAKLVTTHPAARKPSPIRESIPTAHTVSISVHSAQPATVTLDGRTVGATPVTFYVPKSTKAITVGAGRVERTITPDRDQTLEF